MNNITIIAKKELKDIMRSKIFLYMVILLVVLTITSLTVSFLVFNSQVDEYQKSVNVLKQLGKEPPAPPKLYPLTLLRGVVDYIEIVGAILGILLGYISISKERNTKAFKLLLTRPISKRDITYGKIISNALFILALMTVVGIMIILSIYFIGGVMLSGVELLKVFLFIIFSTMYILLFFMISFFLSLQQKTIVHALIISFIIWLVFVLILPQIGDTMDPDNQVPGGLFKSLNIDKPQEKQIMTKFAGYESSREVIEQMSITKHYERAIFGFFGIKAVYNDMPLLEVLNAVMVNMLVLIISVVFGFLLLRNKSYYER